MDEIQKVLIKLGRKDLAQKYYEKVAGPLKRPRKPVLKPQIVGEVFDWKETKEANRWLDKVWAKGFETYIEDHRDDQLWLLAIKNGTLQQLAEARLADADHSWSINDIIKTLSEVDDYFDEPEDEEEPE